MKEIILIFLILTIIVFSSIYICNYLRNTSKPIVDDLEELEYIIMKEDISKEELIKRADNIKQKWNDINRKWSNIVLHQEIDAIETSLLKIKAKIEVGEKEEGIEDIKTAIFLLNHISEKEKLSIKNIF